MNIDSLKYRISDIDLCEYCGSVLILYILLQRAIICMNKMYSSNFVCTNRYCGQIATYMTYKRELCFGISFQLTVLNDLRN